MIQPIIIIIYRRCGIFYAIIQSLHFRAKGTKSQQHKLKALDSKWNTNNRYAANNACNKIKNRNLPTCYDHPDYIGDRMSIEMWNYSFSEGSESKLSRLKALHAGWDTDNGY